MLKSVLRNSTLPVGLLALSFTTPAGAQESVDLFRAAPVAAPSGLTGNPTDALGMRPGSVGAVGYFAIAPEGVNSLRSGGPKRVRVPLPQGAGTAECDIELKAGAQGEFVVGGAPVNGSLGSICSLVLDDGMVSGLVDSGTHRYRVVPLAGGTHAVVEVRSEAFPNEADPRLPPGTTAQDAPAQDNELCDVKVGGQPKKFGPIRVLVVYTTTAKAGSRNIKADVTELINQFNLIMSAGRTGGNFSVTAELADSMEVNYSESSAPGMSGDLDNLSKLDHPIFRAVHQRRDQTKADLVHMLIKGRQNDGCGIGWLNARLTAPAGISLSDRSCALDNFSFSHELGHNMGMNHDRFVAQKQGYTPKPGPQEFAFGYSVLQCLVRSTMAYDDFCEQSGKRCQRLLAYSNPNLAYSKPNTPGCRNIPYGRPLNAPDAAYNAEQLCRAAPKVANFR